MNDEGTYVDITDTMDTKLKALAAHESQLKVEDVEKFVRGRAEELGKASEQGFTYAEMFKVFRFVDED
jgi:LmbE family N-acetylglucosaminyl deacetylase